MLESMAACMCDIRIAMVYNIYSMYATILIAINRIIIIIYPFN